MQELMAKKRLPQKSRHRVKAKLWLLKLLDLFGQGGDECNGQPLHRDCSCSDSGFAAA